MRLKKVDPKKKESVLFDKKAERSKVEPSTMQKVSGPNYSIYLLKKKSINPRKYRSAISTFSQRHRDLNLKEDTKKTHSE